MREIEFRGKEKIGEWIYGYLGKSYGSLVIDNVAVIPETVGQYIGIRNGKGVKVFEGDILKCEKNNPENPYDPDIDIGVVRWKDGCFRIDDIGYVDMIDNDFDEIEVIGNIHDNPELLEELKNE